MQDILLEACVETYEQALHAEIKGAHRIELCAQLEHGGLTPKPDLVKSLLKVLQIPVKVMIRPRPGNFIYTDDEIREMINEIKLFKAMGIEEIVLGMLQEDGPVHLDQLETLAKAASPMAITFHKAIDDTPDPLHELEQMINMPSNVRSILTSGKQATAKEGYALLKKMLDRFDDRFIIIAAGKVTDKNLAELHQLIGAKEYHGRRIVGDLSGTSLFS